MFPEHHAGGERIEVPGDFEPMSESAEDTRPIHPPTLQESRMAFWVASYAHQVVKEIIETGHANADSFIHLCSALEELEMNIIGGGDFCERADNIWELEQIALGGPPSEPTGTDDDLIPRSTVDAMRKYLDGMDPETAQPTANKSMPEAK